MSNIGVEITFSGDSNSYLHAIRQVIAHMIDCERASFEWHMPNWDSAYPTYMLTVFTEDVMFAYEITRVFNNHFIPND